MPTYSSTVYSSIFPTFVAAIKSANDAALRSSNGATNDTANRITF